MSDEKQSPSSLRKAIEEARQRGDKETALRLGAVLKPLEDVDAKVTAALVAVIATLDWNCSTSAIGRWAEPAELA